MKGDKIFLDSNILCYAADFDDKVRHPVAQRITDIVNAAMICGCDTLYTENLNNGQMIEGMTVINPFIEVAHE